MPPGRMNAVYYYDIEYDKLVMGVSRPRSLTVPSDGLEKFSLINRYVISLAANRGIVGSTIGLNGSGFRPSDQIFVGNTLATSVYYSPQCSGLLRSPSPLFAKLRGSPARGTRRYYGGLLQD